MKKIFTALALTLVLSTPALAADYNHDDHHDNRGDARDHGYDRSGHYDHYYGHPAYSHAPYYYDNYNHHYHRPYYVYQPEVVEPVPIAPVYAQPGLNVDFSL